MSILSQAMREIEQTERAAEKLDNGQATFARLAALSPVEYDRVREAEAKALGARASTLDTEVKKLREAGSSTATGNGAAVLFDDPAPWPDPVDGAAVLNELAATFPRFLVLPDGAADAMALWVLHAHAHDAFLHSPRLNIYSPEKGCGKTTALDVLGGLTPKALRTENVTTAVLFRLVDAHAPTLLIDECDSFLKDNDELRGALNAGHRRGGVHLRCEGDDNKVRAFRTFAPVALAGIRELPGTLADRSIKVRMQRAMQGEMRERFDAKSTEALSDLKRKAARWAADNLAALKQSDPSMGNLYNRQADNWRPLFAVAGAVGGEWPQRIRNAAESLSDADDGSDGVAVLLLEDMRGVFINHGDRLPSSEVCENLAGLNERPWLEWNHGKTINQRQLAKLLKPFGIKPDVIRIGQSTPRGYEVGQFAEAFDRYLLSATPQQSNNGAGFLDIASATSAPNVADEKRENTLEKSHCCGVADRNPLEPWEGDL